MKCPAVLESLQKLETRKKIMWCGKIYQVQVIYSKKLIYCNIITKHLEKKDSHTQNKQNI